jgi:RimJ/RimL family protein N-acetyltransferase
VSDTLKQANTDLDVVRLTRDNCPNNFNDFMRDPQYHEFMLEDGQTLNPKWDFRDELDAPNIRYFGCILDDVLLGYFLFRQLGAILWDGHVCLAPELRNKAGLVAARWSLHLMRTELGNIHFAGFIPTVNRPMIAFAYALGFRKVGVVSDCVILKGRRCGRVLLEM